MKYRVLHIIPYISSKYGGPPYVAKSLNKLFNQNYLKSKILTFGNSENSEDMVFFIFL